MNKKGEIFTYTIINVASEEFQDKVPYMVAVVKQGENKIFTRIDNYEEGKEVKIGMEVEFSRIDENGSKLYKFI
ncbi:hypothetical protein CLHOM_31730 [Clostridium homopropionicum DSM 5847]|uniref:ChsH2 C-terminal OB-fold domain-containing protein n=1 Tax=Clostridium homopropionicum DSM 5847 TaxID=1121318 RepID=A0A0L6Z5P5_9CLOT|nr:OB-fold domain-containing protein [Clostridium homopropionicum]KOA18276.1 hypothetical protein CLHOM_31730 [Clostridium homopropionicum DSM 5847]SFF69983.1 DUF35 OB-fold domain-containing protein, acyl-CoA-associated [Clostridium homopropionicum]